MFGAVTKVLAKPGKNLPERCWKCPVGTFSSGFSSPQCTLFTLKAFSWLYLVYLLLFIWFIYYYLFGLFAACVNQGGCGDSLFTSGRVWLLGGPQISNPNFYPHEWIFFSFFFHHNEQCFGISSAWQKELGLSSDFLENPFLPRHCSELRDAEIFGRGILGLLCSLFSFNPG